MLTNENLDPILEQFENCGDVMVEVRAELDRTTFTILELLGLQPGSLLEFSRSTGENIDIYAGDVLVGWEKCCSWMDPWPYASPTLGTQEHRAFKQTNQFKR